MKNTKFLNSNYYKILKTSFLIQIYNINKEKMLDSQLLIKLKNDFDIIDNNNIKTIFLAINTKNS